MPVYHRHRVVHIHIPKTAGTAIDTAVAGIGDMHWDEHSWYGTATAHGRHWEYQHLTANELWRLSNGSFRDFAFFAVVRNPFDRLVSDFEWRRLVARNDAGASGVIEFEHFHDYLAAIPTDLDHNWDRYIALADRALTNHLIHVRPQWHYMCDRNGTRDDRIAVIRFEHLHDDFVAISRHLGLPAGLERRAPTSRRLADYFDDRAIDVVSRTYRTDLDWFGYEPPSIPDTRDRWHPT